MKKMMAVFFSGCVLIGVGAGITLLELKSWKISDYREDLLAEPVESCEEILAIDMQEYKELEINSSNYYYNLYSTETAVEYDRQCTEEVRIAVDYRGNRPGIYNGGWWTNPDGSTSIGIWIDVDDFSDIAEMVEFAELMFENKTYYTFAETTRVEKVTVYTAYPDKVIFR